MTITQTVEIPANNRSITIEVPREIPAGRTIIAFTPVSEAANSHPCPVCAGNIDPETGNPRYNAKALAAMKESKDRMNGKILTNWHRPQELEEVWKNLLDE